jgi:chemotaxis protein CheD
MSALPVGDEALVRVYLHPGQLVVAVEPTLVMTILGSCVATCLWDARAGVAGVNHFLLPQGPRATGGDPRYGDAAMERLLENVLARGASPDRLVAKVFGGACVIEQFSGMRRAIGDQNAAVAREALAKYGVKIAADETGGTRGRKLLFNTVTGAAMVKEL